MKTFVYWIRAKDENTRRKFVVIGTTVSFLAIFFTWLAFDPFSALRPVSTQRTPEIAGIAAETPSPPIATTLPAQTLIPDIRETPSPTTPPSLPGAASREQFDPVAPNSVPEL